MVQVVSEYVHRQGGHADIHLVTDVALLGIVGVERPVGLSVSREVAACCVMFSTVTACVLCFLAPLFTPILCSAIRDGQLGGGGGVRVGTGGVLVDDAGLGETGVWRRLEPGGVDRAERVNCVCSRVGDGRCERHMVANLLGTTVLLLFVTMWLNKSLYLARRGDVYEGGVLVVVILVRGGVGSLWRGERLGNSWKGRCDLFLGYIMFCLPGHGRVFCLFTWTWEGRQGA